MERSAEPLLERWAEMFPMGFKREPVERAYAILYLAVDAARFVTGQVMRPNGGAGMLW
ncbi:SDR family oxidoreductase [Arthrobacter hankyongi]|nr:SDR family oxidoreductase [Arthrobacter hankyongi]